MTGLLLLASTGCNEPRYLGPYTIAAIPMDPNTPPDPTMPMVPANATVTLPYKTPTDSEQASLTKQSDAAGYEIPFVTYKDVSIEVEYVVKNLDTNTVNASVAMDGSNPYGDYDASTIMVGKDQAPPP